MYLSTTDLYVRILIQREFSTFERPLNCTTQIAILSATLDRHEEIQINEGRKYDTELPSFIGN